MGVRKFEASDLIVGLVDSISVRLSQLSAGEEIDYESLLKVAGLSLPLDARSRFILVSARKKLLKERNFVFGTIHGRGLRCLSDEEKIDLGKNSFRRIRRESGRTARKIGSVDYDKLSNESKVKHNTYLSVLGALGAITQTSKVAALERSVKDAHAQLSIGSTLEALK